MWGVPFFILFFIISVLVSGVSVGIGYILTLLISSIDIGSAIVVGAIVAFSSIYFAKEILIAAAKLPEDDIYRNDDVDYDDDDDDDDEVDALYDVVPSLIKSDFLHPRHTNHTSPKRKRRKK